MSHVQTQILSRIGVLLTGLTTTGLRVYQGSVHPETPSSMPGLTYTVGSERPAGGDLQSTLKEFDLTLACYAAGDDWVVTNQVALEVAAALYSNDATLNTLALSVVYGGSSREYRPGAAYRHTKLSVTYKLQYETEDGKDGIAI